MFTKSLAVSAIILFSLVSSAFEKNINFEPLTEEQKQAEAEAYFKETSEAGTFKNFFDDFYNFENTEYSFILDQMDRCFTTHVSNGCVVEGRKIRVQFPHGKFYTQVSVFDFESKNGTTNGRPNIEAKGAEIGAGVKRSIINQALTIFGEVSYRYTEENENFWNNKNFNSGFVVRTGLDYRINDKWSTGFNVMYDRSENSSHIGGHGKGSAKGNQDYANGEFHIARSFDEFIIVKFKVIKMIKKPDLNDTSVGDGVYGQEFPGTGYALELTYIPGKRK